VAGFLGRGDESDTDTETEEEQHITHKQYIRAASISDGHNMKATSCKGKQKQAHVKK